MNSYLFGIGVPKLVSGGTEFSIENSFIESIQIEAKDIEHESIINTTRNWTNITTYDHITVSILCRLHKISSPLDWWKSFYNTYHKTEVTSFAPSQTADIFIDEGGNAVKFRLQIAELFPLEVPWLADTFRMILRSKKPVKLSALTITPLPGRTVTDTDGTEITDTDGTEITE